MTPKQEQRLAVQRLVVTKSGEFAYDEQFHRGVNIIRGENSSGKSSIMDLLFYGLGGDFIAWKPEPASCDSVYIEAQFNDEIATVRRDITEKKGQPLWIYFGSMDEGLKNSDAWRRYAYARSGDRESFSQAVFRLLDIPDVTADDDTNLTMHQLLRILYADQMTPVSRLFRFEQFDTPQRRQAVGDLICGVYDGRIYVAQSTLRQKNKEFDEIAGDLQNIYRILGGSEGNVSIEFIDHAEAKAREELQEIEAQIERLRQRASGDLETKKNLQQGIVEKLRSDISRLTDQISSLHDEFSELEFSIEDSKSLVSELSTNLQQLDDGFAVRQALAGYNFNFCPACYAVLEETDKDRCQLCKAPFEGADEERRLARIRSQIELQMKESDRLIGMKAEQRDSKSQQIRKLEALRESLQGEYRAIRADYSSEESAELEQAISRRGYKSRELEEIAARRERVQFVLDLQTRKAELNAEISDLKEMLSQLEIQARTRRERVMTLVSTKAGQILERDLKSEKEFVHDPVVSFSFWDDSISVNDRKSFSASSLTVLRNAVHFALLWASTEDEQMYYPRFLMMDNVEDKGMTQERSQNFQRLLVELSANMEAEHQVIFTTSMIAPEFEDGKLVIGDHYTFDHKSLNV